jgi:hypothetical protein
MRMRTKTKRRKRTKKRIGSSGGAALILALAAVLLPFPGSAKKKSKDAPAPYGIVAGTVFQESGLSLRGAEVELAPKPEAGQQAPKLKETKAVSDSRGEFAFRVPAVPMRYAVKVKAAGFAPDTKTVSVNGEERVDATFQLRAESK